MPAHRESAVLRIIKRAPPVVVLILLLFADLRSSSVMEQAKGPAPVFGPALEQIQSQTRIPILLPSKLPSAIPEKDIKVATGEVREDGYFISLYFSEDGGDELSPPVLVVPRVSSVPKICRIHGRSPCRAVALACSGLFRVVAPVHLQTCGGSRTA